MKEMGMNVAKLVNLPGATWSKEGKYDFRSCSMLYRNLTRRNYSNYGHAYLRLLRGLLKASRGYDCKLHGVRETHGAEACMSNNPVYREYTRKIVTNMAQAQDCDSIVDGR